MIKKLILYALLTIILICFNVRGEILINQPSSLYNYGDAFDMKITLKEPLGVSSLFLINIVCENGEKNLMSKWLWINKEEEEIDYPILFFKPYLENLKGECKIVVNFGDEKKETNSFILSDKIHVYLNLNQTTLLPSETLVISGKAIKENGKNVNGIVEVWADKEKNLLLGTGKVSDGKFSFSIEIPPKLEAKTYDVLVYVYETQNNEISNNGEAFMQIKVNQKPTKIEIALYKQNYKPGENFSFSVTLYDQSDKKMFGGITVKVYDSKENLITEKIIESGKSENIFLQKNSSWGYWKIIAKYNDVVEEKNFFVEKIEEFNYYFKDGFLVLENIGNTFYNRSLEIKIDDYIKIINLEMDIGEKKYIQLEAPDGEHLITLNDGERNISLENVSFRGFSGYAVKFVEEEKNYQISYFIGLVVVFILMFIFIKKQTSKEKKEEKKEKKGIIIEKPVIKVKVKKLPSHEETESYVDNKNIFEAERVSVLKGIKENVTFLCLRIENLEKIENNIRETLEKIKEEIIKEKGSIYKVQNYIFGIYTSLITKTLQNEIKAARSAKNIFNIIYKHNKIYKEKLRFCISIVNGYAVVKKEEKLKFLPLDNALSKARKISNISEEEILVSDSIYKKIINNFHALKKVFEGLEVYSLKEEIKKEEYKKFINDFLKRNK